MDAACNTDLAEITYQHVKEIAGTATKSVIGTSLEITINGSFSDDSPFLFTGIKNDNIPVFIKVLRVLDGALNLEIRQKMIANEINACNFIHDSIIRMEYRSINIDSETARVANCRVGSNHVLIMPRLLGNLGTFPTTKLRYLAIQGKKILNALNYLHIQMKYMHMDIKRQNIFVDHQANWFLGDFGSCTLLGETIYSSTIIFCFEDCLFKKAHSKYDIFMLLLLILIETLHHRNEAEELFYTVGSNHADYAMVITYTENLVQNTQITEFKEFLQLLIDSLHELNV